jgi:hypothetical protein
MYVILGAITLVVMVAALADIITREEWQVKHLPKFFWVILVVLLPFVGSVLWFAIGREYSKPVDLGSFGDPRRWGGASDSAARGNAVGDGPGGVSNTERELELLEHEIARAEQEARIRRLELELERRRQSDESGRSTS